MQSLCALLEICTLFVACPCHLIRWCIVLSAINKIMMMLHAVFFLWGLGMLQVQLQQNRRWASNGPCSTASRASLFPWLPSTPSPSLGVSPFCSFPFCESQCSMPHHAYKSRGMASQSYVQPLLTCKGLLLTWRA
jgi:hypothetical protein